MIDMQNAAELSRLELARERDPDIGAALAAGRFVVVQISPAYCRVTDARIGSSRAFISAHDTREAAAAAAAAAENECWELDPENGSWEEGFEVLPRLAPQQTASDDIPF